MKKIILVTISLILVFMFCACQRGEQTGKSNPEQTTASEDSPASATEQQTDVTGEGRGDIITEESNEGRGDIFEEQVPDGAELIMQGVYYYELVELSGDTGDGLSPREGAELANDLLASIGLYSKNGGISADNCVYISLDELAVLDFAMGRECYIYSVGIGTPEGGLMGDDYQVIYRISVDYSGEKTAAIYEDFSNGKR